MVVTNPTTLLIALNINEPNTQIKSRDCQIDRKKVRLNYMWSTEEILKIQRHKVKVKEWGK